MRVGIFDSGLGGLSILREILRQQPALELDYYADQKRIPWGPRPAPELRHYCASITDAFLARGCQRIVLACNTASAVALASLRQTYPQVPFVGMEPAIKPAAQLTRSGVVGVLATPATLAGELLAQTRLRHAAHIRIVSDPCTGLVEAIEADDQTAIKQRLAQIIPPLCAAGADVLVLGCTHYGFVQQQIAALTGPEVRVVDPAPAVAAQLLRLCGELDPQGALRLHFHTSGDPQRFAAQASRILQLPLQATGADWVRAMPAVLPSN